MKTTCARRAPRRGDAVEGGAKKLGAGLNEAGMVVEGPQARDLRRRVAERRLRLVDVLSVLPAARVAAEAGREERERSLDAVGRHVADRVGEEGMPVAVADVDRHVGAMREEVGPERLGQRPILRVDGADAVEERVVLGHSLEALAGDFAPFRHRSRGTA